MTTDVIDYDKQVGKSWQIGTVVEGHTNNLYKDDHFLLHMLDILALEPCLGFGRWRNPKIGWSSAIGGKEVLKKTPPQKNKTQA